MGSQSNTRYAAFPQTHASLLRLATDREGTQFRFAWEQFFRAYWPPLYSYLRRSGSLREEALDLLQEFFIQGMEGRLLARYEARCGKLRTYLIACLRNLRADAGRKARSRPDRSPLIPLEDSDRIEAAVSAAPTSDADGMFEEDWAKHLLSRAIGALEGRFEADRDTTSLRLMREWILADRRVPAQKLADELGIERGDLYTRATRLRHAIAAEVHAQASLCAADDEEIRTTCAQLVQRLPRQDSGGTGTE